MSNAKMSMELGNLVKLAFRNFSEQDNTFRKSVDWRQSWDEVQRRALANAFLAVQNYDPNTANDHLHGELPCHLTGLWRGSLAKTSISPSHAKIGFLLTLARGPKTKKAFSAELGTDARTLAKMERGYWDLTLGELKMIARFFGVKIADLKLD